MPESIGLGKNDFVVGKHSGRSGIRHVLKQNRIIAQEDRLPDFVDCVRKAAMKKEGSLSTKELIDLYHITSLF